MLSKAQVVRPSLQDQKMELQRKIHLMEGERTAFYERTQSLKKKNQELVSQLRQENQKLHRELAEVDGHNLSKEKVVAKRKQEQMSRRRRLDVQRHATQTCQQRLDELKMEEMRLKQQHSSGAASSKALVFEKEEDAMNFRSMENRLDKFQFKCKEAEKCLLINQKLKAQMQDEFRTYGGQIDSLEAELLKSREELYNLVQNRDAQLFRKAAEVELQQLEEQLSKEQKERETNIATLRQKVEQRKSQAEKAEKKVQRTIMQPDELASEAQHSPSRITAEEEKAFCTFEEAFRSIKEATGVTDMQEVVEDVILQKENLQRLEKLKQDNEEVLLQLKEEKELLSQQFENMKYSGEAKLSSEQETLEECEQQLQVQQQRREAAAKRLTSHVKTLSTIRAGVEHLAGKLQHISLTEDRASKAPSDADEFVPELLTQCELKSKILRKELEGLDLASVMKEIEEDEFYTTIERKLPKNNTKVKLPEETTQDLNKEEGETKEEEGDIMSREALKRQSQLIVDSNSKKKAWKK